MISSIIRGLGSAAAIAVLFSLSLDDTSIHLFRQAEAVVGVPVSPVSYRGVARRTTRRTVHVASSAAATSNAAAAANSAAATEAEQAAEQAQAAAAQATYAAEQANAANEQALAAPQSTGGTLPLGSTVPSLPSGCDSRTVNDQSYFVCGANWFRPAMQGGNIVYSVVSQPV